MTTPQAAEAYLAQHLAQFGDRRPAVYDPHNFGQQHLPTIYGFNNGGPSDWLQGVLIAEDGTVLGSHICSHENYMPHDLGILEGSRPDRHETFRAHYPDGYRMEFIGYAQAHTHEGLRAALTRNAQLVPPSEDAAE